MRDSGLSATTESRRKAILGAALACFISKGFSETTMEDIRNLSGASIGSIYHHFANKELLARALYLESRTSLNATLRAVLDFSLDGHPPREGIEALAHAYLGWFEAHPDLGQYLMHAGESEYLSAYVKVLRQKTRTSLPPEAFSGRLLQWLAPHIHSGSVIELPPFLYIPLILGPSREFVRVWLRTRDLAEMRAARDPLARAAWRAVAATT